MSQAYRRTQTTVSLINYHFVFCPRYRRKVLVGVVEERLKILLSEICEEMDIQILVVEWDKDHCHLFVNSLPTISPSDIMAKIERSDIEKIATGVFTPEAFAKSVDTKLFCIYRRKCIKRNDKVLCRRTKNKGVKLCK